MARRRVDALGLDPRQRAGKLSGGQHAQLALTLAIAKRPELLVLDEPVASLDPLARREFLQRLMEAVADDDISVMLSSHLVADLERVCDYLVVLADSQVQLAGDVEDLLACHHRLTGARRDPATLPADQQVIEPSHTDRQSTLIVRTDGPISTRPGRSNRSVWKTSCSPTCAAPARTPSRPHRWGRSMIRLTWRQFRTQAARRRRPARRGRDRARHHRPAPRTPVRHLRRRSGSLRHQPELPAGHDQPQSAGPAARAARHRCWSPSPHWSAPSGARPLIAREFENGTHRLAWTQSVSRTRWLAVEARSSSAPRA